MLLWRTVKFQHFPHVSANALLDVKTDQKRQYDPFHVYYNYLKLDGIHTSVGIYMHTCTSLIMLCQGRITFIHAEFDNKTSIYYQKQLLMTLGCNNSRALVKQGPILQICRLYLISTLISYYIRYKEWNEITYSFSNFNGYTVDVWKWIQNFITFYKIDVITYPYWV